MKKLIFLLFLFITQINFGQSNIVEINTTGSGETKEEAVQNALLSALKQSFGVFISSNTEIINDVLTKDKISELSSGNILEYNIISETQNGNYYNTLVSSKISMNTLASYTKNKVDSNEISGDVFVSNFLIKELNKENELQSIKDLIEFSKKVLPTTLDFFINSGEPISIKYDEKIHYKSLKNSNNLPYQFLVQSKIGYKQNIKYKNWRDHFNRTIKSIDLDENQISEYLNSNIDTYPFILNNEVLYLRNISSIQSLIEFFILSNKSFFHFNLKYNGLDKSYDIKDFVYENIDSIYQNRTYYGMKENNYPDDLVVEELEYAIIKDGKIEFFDDDCIKCNEWNWPNTLSDIYGEDYGKASFPFNNLIKFSDIISGRYPVIYEKYQIIDSFFFKGKSFGELITDGWFDKKKKKNDFPKKYRTKENYKKLDNTLLIVNQMRGNSNKRAFLQYVFGSYRNFKYDDYTLILQTNLSFDQAMIIKSYFTLDDLKKFRGFQITNSN